MTTVRRLYLYLAVFIGLLLAVTGIIALIGMLVDQGFDAFRGFSVTSSASVLALIIVGGAAWGFYWRLVQRDANSAPQERANGTRKAYLYGVMTLSLVVGLVILQLLLSEMLIRLFDTSWRGYKPWTPLLSAILLAVIWRWHDWIALTDQSAHSDGTRGGDLRRGHWFVMAAYGVFSAISGLTTFFAGLLSHLGGRAPSPASGTWMQTLFPPLVQILVGLVVIWFFWRPSQLKAAAGDEIERSSRLRSILIHLVVFVGAIFVLFGTQAVLINILGRLLNGSSRDSLLVLTLNGPLAQIVVGALIGWYFFKAVRPTLNIPRLAEYIIAGVAFFMGLIAFVALLTALLQTLGGRGQRIETLIAQILPGLLIGGGVWWWRWSRLQKEAKATVPAAALVAAPAADATVVAISGEAAMAQPVVNEAQTYLWRKVYLYFYQFVGLIMLLISCVILLQVVFTQILGPSSRSGSGNALADLASPLALLIVGGGLMFYLVRVITTDARLSGLSADELMRRTLGDAWPTWVPIVLIFGVLPIFITVLLALLGPAIGNIFNSISGSL